MIHKEGYFIIGGSLIAFILIGALSAYFLPYWASGIINTVLWVLFFFIVWFFRNPKRVTLAQDGEIIAPVDGKVVVIEETEENEYFKDKRLQISIFMSPLNVHVCRYPLSGAVKYSKYHPGKFLVAWHPKSSTENERTTVVVEQKGTQVLFRQIAGALARRIVLYAAVGNNAKAGDDFGFIKFGSRVDIFLPIGTEVNVKLDEITKGGVTRIAKLK